MKKTVWAPVDWQRDPTNITTTKVQYWRNGSMLTALMTQETARRLVGDGKAFVITSQAIGDINGS